MKRQRNTSSDATRITWLCPRYVNVLKLHCCTQVTWLHRQNDFRTTASIERRLWGERKPNPPAKRRFVFLVGIPTVNFKIRFRRSDFHTWWPPLALRHPCGGGSPRTNKCWDIWIPKWHKWSQKYSVERRAWRFLTSDTVTLNNVLYSKAIPKYFIFFKWIALSMVFFQLLTESPNWDEFVLDIKIIQWLNNDVEYLRLAPICLHEVLMNVLQSKFTTIIWQDATHWTTGYCVQPGKCWIHESLPTNWIGSNIGKFDHRTRESGVSGERAW